VPDPWQPSPSLAGQVPSPPATQPSAPPAVQMCQPELQPEVSPQICGLPCLLPQPSRRGSPKTGGNPNPIIILCQNDYCLPYSVGCPPGTVFDGRSACVPPTVQDPSGISGPELEARQNEASMATRLQHRMRSRVTLEMDGGLGFLREPDFSREVDLFSARAMLGYRMQFTPQLGLQVRVGGRLGVASYRARTVSANGWQTPADDQMVFGGGLVELMPFVGPIGRFYLGPIGQLGYLTYEKDALRSGSETVPLHAGLTAGGGLHGGVVLTDKEMVAVHFSTIVAYHDGLALLFTVGVGYHR
jgi:hypothetical protein